MQPAPGEEKNELCDGFLSCKVFNCLLSVSSVSCRQNKTAERG